MEGFRSMNHAPAINIWKGNRISRLWEQLLADRVPPDPPILEVRLSAPRSEQTMAAEPSLLERAGFESLRLIKQALDILSSPPNEEPQAGTCWAQDQEPLPESLKNWEDARLHEPIQADSPVGLTFIKVSREPESQAASAIDTRRIAYGLKIPMKPLHKRPIYQRVFFCLRQMMARGSDGAFTR
jgi:hypothetical protein